MYIVAHGLSEILIYVYVRFTCLCTYFVKYIKIVEVYSSI